MSLAKIFGGGKKKEAAPSTQDAIQKLQTTEELLQKKSNHLEGKIAEEIATARKAGTKNKRGKGPSRYLTHSFHLYLILSFREKESQEVSYRSVFMYNYAECLYRGIYPFYVY